MNQHENVGVVKPMMLSYLWEIKNFRVSCINNGEYLISPVFSTRHSSKEHKWRLHIFPKGHKTEDCKDWISIFVKNMGVMGDSNVAVNITLSLLNDKNCKMIEKSFQNLYSKGSAPYGFLRYVEQDFITDQRNRILVNDTINILCEISYDSNLAEPLKKKFKSEASSEYCRLKEFDEFEKLLEEENSTSDIVIRIGKNKIKAHKAIIMGRSPVFRAMFEHDMKEKEHNVVDITDVTYEVMKEVVRFMYTGKVNNIDKIAGDLLVAAEKYLIQGLKVLSETKLFEKLTVANVVEYLKLADMYNGNHLKAKIIQFIVSKHKNIVHEPEFKLLPSKLVCEVLYAVLDNDREE